MMVLIDTSVWIEFFNHPQGNIAGHVERLLLESIPVCINAVIEMEILQGIRNEKEYTATKSYLTDFQYFPYFEKSCFDMSVDIFRTCRKKGVTIRRSLDCLIAANCLMEDLSVIHHDRDFDQISKVFKELTVKSI